MKKTLAIGMASLFGLAAIGTVSAHTHYRHNFKNNVVYKIEKVSTDKAYSSNYLDSKRKAARIGVTTKAIPNYVFEHYNGGYYLPFYESERIGQKTTVTERPVYSKYEETKVVKERKVREIPSEEIEDRSIYGVNYVKDRTVEAKCVFEK